jgi:hypothetical protein
MKIQKATTARIIKKAEARETERMLAWVQEHWEEFTLTATVDSEPGYTWDDCYPTSLNIKIDYWDNDGQQ